MNTGDQFDRALDAIGHTHRRRLLVALLDHNPQATTDVLRPSNGTEIDPETMEIQLVHNHLPRLDDLGYISWHREQGEIRKGENWTDIEPLLQLLRDHVDEYPDASH